MAKKCIPLEFTCVNCQSTTLRKPSQICHGTQGVLAGLKFCNRECQKAFFRGHVSCSWPGCKNGRSVEGGNFRRKTARGWFCHKHTERMFRFTGSDKVTSKKLDFLSGKSMDHNRLTWIFIKFAIFDRDNGFCCDCARQLDFFVSPVEFNVDHKVPVWQGGETSVANLHILCLDCHRKKSALEQKTVNKTRWAGRDAAGFRHQTHYEKDILISKLTKQISDLRAELDIANGLSDRSKELFHNAYFASSY